MTEFGQSDASLKSNASYFLEHISEYHRSVATIDTYETLRQFISGKVSGTENLLDVGNGGVFDYDTSGVGHITAIDLFLDNLPADFIAKYFPANCSPVGGSALNLPEPDEKFDMVLMVMLLHHLTGLDWKTSWNNARLALDEAWRVLKPGGRLLIVESCVPPWFFAFEKFAIRMLSSLFNAIFSHPLTLQFPPDMVREELRKRFATTKVTKIPKGKFVLQFGVKLPSLLTPAMIVAFEATKEG